MVRATQIRSARTNRLYTRLTATEVRRQLIAQKGYRKEELPTAETIATKMNELGYYRQKGSQEPTPKKLPDTDAIFAQMKLLNEEADAASDTLRISMDGKRDGQSRPLCPWREKSCEHQGRRPRLSTCCNGHTRGNFPGPPPMSCFSMP